MSALLVVILASHQEGSRASVSGEAPLARVLADLARQCPGEKAACDPELEGRSVRVEIADKPFFEALHLLCVQNEGIRLEVGDEVRLRAGRYVPGATSCSGPFVFQLRELRVKRSVQGEGRRDLELRVAARSQGNVTPAEGTLKLKGFEEESSDEEVTDPPQRWSRLHRLVRTRPSVLGLKLSEIPPGQKRLDAAGEAAFHFIVESAPVTVDVPVDETLEGRQPLEDKRFTLTLSRRGSGLHVGLESSFPRGEDGEEIFTLYERRFNPSTIEFLSEDGEPFELEERGSGSGLGRCNYHFSVEIDPPAKVRVTLPKKVRRQAVPVEFKDVPLE